jgi:hypothetical protein
LLHTVDVKWLEDSLSENDKWKLRASDILVAMHKQEVKTVAGIRGATPRTWNKIVVDGESLPGRIEDLIKVKAGGIILHPTIFPHIFHIFTSQLIFHSPHSFVRNLPQYMWLIFIYYSSPSSPPTSP